MVQRDSTRSHDTTRAVLLDEPESALGSVNERVILNIIFHFLNKSITKNMLKVTCLSQRNLVE